MLTFLPLTRFAFDNEGVILSIESLPREIAEAKVHEGYSRETISNDVAVVKVSEPFVFDGKY